MAKRSVIILLHVGYWLLYGLLISVFIFAVGHARRTFFASDFLYIFFLSPLFWGAIFPGVLTFYIFYFFLFPRYLQRKKFLRLFLAGIGITLAVALMAIGILTIKRVTGKTYSAGEFIAMTATVGLVALVHGIIALVMHGFISWYGDIRLKDQLNKKNYEMELALVKSQINPHFLFNTLNNIDVLIEMDAVKASAYLNKLSDILRFMLYETKTGKIPLEKELLYIGKYIDLQKIRTSNPNYISYIVEGDPGDIMIEPMLFIPFIENAFKHAEDKKIEDAIRIRFLIEKGSITFDCENRFSPYRQGSPDHSGLGNGLIKKRLSLLYPDRHLLQIENGYETYKAKLILHGNIH